MHICREVILRDYQMDVSEFCEITSLPGFPTKTRENKKIESNTPSSVGIYARWILSQDYDVFYEMWTEMMKRRKIDIEDALEKLDPSALQKRKTSAENLDLDYIHLLPKDLADELLQQLEFTVEYLDGDLTKVKVFGKWHQIPRQQVAFGDEGMEYRFSGVTVPARPWNPLLKSVQRLINRVTGFDYNFVLINRYRSGNDHIGEHKDNEAELDKNTPIASLSLGQQRLFVLKHQDCRKKGKEKRNLPQVKMELQHGSLLMMNPPTNNYWYHSLPPRKNAPGVRINMTFRKINTKK